MIALQLLPAVPSGVYLFPLSLLYAFHGLPLGYLYSVSHIRSRSFVLVLCQSVLPDTCFLSFYSFWLFHSSIAIYYSRFYFVKRCYVSVSRILIYSIIKPVSFILLFIPSLPRLCLLFFPILIEFWLSPP